VKEASGSAATKVPAFIRNSERGILPDDFESLGEILPPIPTIFLFSQTKPRRISSARRKGRMNILETKVMKNRTIITVLIMNLMLKKMPTNTPITRSSEYPHQIY